MSIVTNSCLETAIGLSQTACDCYDTDRPAGYNISDSNLYLDELDGLPINLVDAAADCTNGSVWDILEKSRRNAIYDLEEDVNKALSNAVILSRPLFNGNIGDVNPKGYNEPNSQYCGLTWLSHGIASGNMRISKIRLAINTTTSKTVTLYSSEQVAPLGSYVINCVQNTYSEVLVNLDLPMVNTNGGCIRYWLVYDKTGIKPMKTTLTCGCGKGNTAVWNGLSYVGPTGTYKNQYGWFDWINAAGTNGNDLTNKTAWSCNTSFTYGLQLEVSFACVLSDVICQNLDYKANPAAKVLASALRYKAGEKAINTILSTGNINRYTILDNESLWGRRNHYAKMYEDKIFGNAKENEPGILALMDLTKTGCYKCKPGMRMVTI